MAPLNFHYPKIMLGAARTAGLFSLEHRSTSCRTRASPPVYEGRLKGLDVDASRLSWCQFGDKMTKVYLGGDFLH